MTVSGSSTLADGNPSKNINFKLIITSYVIATNFPVTSIATYTPAIPFDRIKKISVSTYDDNYISIYSTYAYHVYPTSEGLIGTRVETYGKAYVYAYSSNNSFSCKWEVGSNGRFPYVSFHFTHNYNH